MSSQPVISKEDIQTIFSNIETVNEIHSEFVKSLEAKVMNWTHGERIGDIFKIMVSCADGLVRIVLARVLCEREANDQEVNRAIKSQKNTKLFVSFHESFLFPNSLCVFACKLLTT